MEILALLFLMFAFGKKGGNGNGNGNGNGAGKQTGFDTNGNAPIVIDGNANGWPWRARNYADVVNEPLAVGLHIEMLAGPDCATRSAIVDDSTAALNQAAAWGVQLGPAPANLNCPGW